MEADASAGACHHATDPRLAGIVMDRVYLDHVAWPGHVESPSRLKAIHEGLNDSQVLSRCRVLFPRLATREELEWNHTPRYLDRLALTEGRDQCLLDPDTGTGPASWRVARLAVGGVFCALDAVFDKRIRNGFTLVRPPGHHAEADTAMGFCLLNNVALGAHYARRVLGCAKVLIVDWDLHHGNGTQNSFYTDSSVLYFSTHQHPHYPGSGRVGQTGTGAGEGFTVNVPMAAGAGDEDFAAVFRRVLMPIGRKFQPDLVLVSAGFDISRDDPLGGMNVSADGFAYLARCLLKLADDCCGGRILFCLEGGYNRRDLRDGVLAVLGECVGSSVLPEAEAARLEAAGPGPEIVREVIAIHRAWWPLDE